MKDDKLYRVTKTFSKSFEAPKEGTEHHVRAVDIAAAEKIASDLYGECHVQEETDPHVLLRKKNW